MHKEDKQVKQHVYRNDSNYLNNFISGVRNLWSTLTIFPRKGEGGGGVFE